MRNDVSPPSADLDKLLSWPQVRPMIGDQGRTTWWRAIRRGEAPMPVRVSPGRVAWRASDILAWQVARQRDAFGGVSDEEVRRRTLDGRIPKPTKLGSRPKAPGGRRRCTPAQ